MKDYRKTASEVLRLVGGEKNVTHLEHCSTRLRFSLADPGKADVSGLKKTPGVMGVVSAGTQCQVVIGNDVIEVYNELTKLGTFDGTAGAADNGGQPSGGKKGKVNVGAVILDYMVGIFQPLVPAIAGAGVLKAILTLLVSVGWMSSDSVTYQVFNLVASSALNYLPILVAFTTARKFKCNPLVAVALCATLVAPGTSTLLATEGGAKLFGLTLQNINYSGQVFPSILIVIFMSFLEKWCNKWCPKAIRVFFVPMFCFAIAFPIGILFLGPLGYNIGALLTAAILAIYNTLGWLAVAIVAAILPFMISLGMHKALVPYAVSSISSPGFDMLYLPASLAHNISEGGACLAVAVKTKNEDLKATAISAGISGLFGITEPALYGVTLQHKKVMQSVVISSFIGGLFIGIMKVKAFTVVGPGIASMAMYIDPDNSMNIVWAFAGLAISVGVSFILTLFLYKDPRPETESAGSNGGTVEGGAAAAIADGTSGDAKAAVQDTVICSPLKGKAVPLSEVKDEVFSGEVLGKGAAVVPEDGKIYAPCDATIQQVFSTKHAISLVADSGAEILIHVGMDTVKLNGEGFVASVKDGDHVKKGDLLLTADFDKIKAAGYDITTPVVITNSDDYASITPENLGEILPGTELLKLKAN